MPKENAGVKERTGFHTQEPGKYHVIIHNDDVTTMDFVVCLLEKVFRKPHNEAEALMLHVHRFGSATAGVYCYDIAVSKRDLATKMARAEGFPLLLTIKPE